LIPSCIPQVMAEDGQSCHHQPMHFSSWLRTRAPSPLICSLIPPDWQNLVNQVQILLLSLQKEPSITSHNSHSLLTLVPKSLQTQKPPSSSLLSQVLQSTLSSTLFPIQYIITTPYQTLPIPPPHSSNSRYGCYTTDPLHWQWLRPAQAR